MRIILKQEELINLINDYFKSQLKIDNVSIEVKTEKGFNEIVSFKKDSYFIGSFIKEEIKNEKRS